MPPEEPIVRLVIVVQVIPSRVPWSATVLPDPLAANWMPRLNPWPQVMTGFWAPGGVGADVVIVITAAFAIALTVIFELVPVKPPPVAVTVWTVPVVALTVNVTVAMPLAFVVLVADEKEPPVPVLDQVTTTPDVAIAVPAEFASWAVIVTAAPGTGV